MVIDPASGSIVAPEPVPVDGKDYLHRLRVAGVRVATVTLAAHAEGFDEFLRNVHAYLCLFQARPDETMPVRSVDDILAAAESERLGVVFGSQTGSIVGREIWRWEIVRALGLRQCCLTYSERNALADGCAEPENRGLTADGRQAVQEMNRLGITIDISHVGERSSLETIERSSRPVIASHSNVRGVSPSIRNLSADVMRELAAADGVMGISSFSAMCVREPGVRPTLGDYLDMIDAAVQAVGIDHVGIGTDLYESYTRLSWESTTKRMYPSPWVFGTRYADGFHSVDCWPGVIDGLQDRGYRGEDLARLVGGNWLRVYRRTWLADDIPFHTTLADAGKDTYLVGASQ
jgi:membrane dipeptidase